MIKFIHKKHIHENHKNKKLIIYYSGLDVFLGSLLMILVLFFIHDYLSHTLNFYNKSKAYTVPPVTNQSLVRSKIPKY